MNGIADWKYQRYLNNYSQLNRDVLFAFKWLYNDDITLMLMQAHLKRRTYIQFFIFWLVAMQLISPFLHAHAFGVGAVHGGPGVHIHLDEIEMAASPTSNKPAIHNEVLPEHSISMTTGVSEKFEFEGLLPFIFTVISFALYLAYAQRCYAQKTAPILDFQSHPPSPPRAPPSRH